MDILTESRRNDAKLLQVLERYLIEQWQWQWIQQMNEQANTASNIMMQLPCTMTTET